MGFFYTCFIFVFLYYPPFFSFNVLYLLSFFSIVMILFYRKEVSILLKTPLIISM